MIEPLEDEFHYIEETFEFPLWKLIKQKAEEEDISYLKAAGLVLPDYVKTIRYRDEEWEDNLIAGRKKELDELRKRNEEEQK